MDGLHERQTQRLYFAALCLISLGLAVLSLVGDSSASLPQNIVGLVWGFSLGAENNLAAWWSGVLLLLGALHAVDGYYRYRSEDRSVACAWLVIAAVLVALSLDEVGSLHERVAYLPFGAWWSVLPFAVVLLGAAAWSFWQLWQVQAYRHSALLLALGFACFVSVAGQEELEWTLQWPAWMLPIRMAVEEGTELVGMLLLIKATMSNSVGLFAGSRGDNQPALTAGHTLPATALLIAMACVPVFALVTASLPDQERGHPADWLAAALLFLAALASLRNLLQGDSWPSPRLIGLGVVFLAASVASVQISPDATMAFGAHVWSTRLFVLAFLLVIAALMLCVLSDEPAQRRPVYGLLAMAGMTSAFAYFDANLLTTYMLTGAIAVFAHCLAAPQVTELAVRILLGSPTVAIEQGALSQPGQLLPPNSREWQLHMLESTQDAVIIWEMDGKGIQYWNGAAERLYGFGRDEVYGKVTHSLLSTEPVGGAVNDLEARLARYGVWVGELIHTDRAGQLIEVESRLSLLAQRDGRWLVLEVNRALTDPEQATRARAAAERVFDLRRYAGSIAG